MTVGVICHTELLMNAPYIHVPMCLTRVWMPWTFVTLVVTFVRTAFTHNKLCVTCMNERDILYRACNHYTLCVACVQKPYNHVTLCVSCVRMPFIHAELCVSCVQVRNTHVTPCVTCMHQSWNHVKLGVTCGHAT